VQNKIDKERYHRLYPLSEKFGLALQKVNIIRDVSYDVALKRFYWPKSLLEKYHLAYDTLCRRENRSQSFQVLLRMIENARKCLDYAVDYIKLLPRRQLRLRVFCLIPMFMAIYSLQKCIDNENVFVQGKKVKISRQLVRKITARSYVYGWSNLLIAKWYERAMMGFSPLESLTVNKA
jgi:farnesyl-diphosphate farnesyltransferase